MPSAAVPAPLTDLAALRAARQRLVGRVHQTPLLSASSIGARVGTRLSLKCENLQKTGSFKVRGVLNRLRALDAAQRAGALVTLSAGNHAQALAWGAAAEGIPATVVMPAAASPAKAAASRAYGAEVILHGDAFEAFEKAHALEAERGLTFVHPFDDPLIIEGAAGVGLELVEQQPDVTAAIVPVGGGGLIAGVAAAVTLSVPVARIYGVEPEGAAAMRASLDAGHAVRLDRVERTIADGLAPPMAGTLPFAYVRAYVADVVTVTDEEVREAMRWIYGRARLVVEPSAAAGVAALLAGRIPVGSDDRTVAVLSGGNVPLDRLTELLAPGP